MRDYGALTLRIKSLGAWAGPPEGAPTLSVIANRASLDANICDSLH